MYTNLVDEQCRPVQGVHVEKRKCCEPSAKASGERSMQGEGDAAPSRGVRRSEGGEGRGAKVGGARGAPKSRVIAKKGGSQKY